MKIFYVEQTVTGLKGEYLTDAMVLAEDAESALGVCLEMAKTWGIIAQKKRLEVICCAQNVFEPAVETLRKRAHHKNPNAAVIVAGTGKDDD